MENIQDQKASEQPPFTRKDIHQQVTDTIISQLEKGTIPWQQSWVNKGSAFNLPKNIITGNKYRGINIVLLWSASVEKKYNTQEWGSFKQWQSKKETIRKGEKGTYIVYADTFEKEVEGELKKIPFLKSSVVFNRAQLASFNPEEEIPTPVVETDIDRNARMDDFIDNTFAQIEHRDGGACYVPSSDQIYMPKPSSFIDLGNCTASENYYSTLLHELTHWTGHKSRMDRFKKTGYGKDSYAQEELIAELGAAFLTTEFGITNPEQENHAGYIAGWLNVLKNDKHFIVSAASEASKAVEYMTEMQPLQFNN